MVELQRKMAETQDVIMEGRDITTVVFPNADVKIFLVGNKIDIPEENETEPEEIDINEICDEIVWGHRYQKREFMNLLGIDSMENVNSSIVEQFLEEWDQWGVEEDDFGDEISFSNHLRPSEIGFIEKSRLTQEKLEKLLSKLTPEK